MPVAILTLLIHHESNEHNAKAPLYHHHLGTLQTNEEFNQSHTHTHAGADKWEESTKKKNPVTVSSLMNNRSISVYFYKALQRFLLIKLILVARMEPCLLPSIFAPLPQLHHNERPG